MHDRTSKGEALLRHYKYAIAFVGILLGLCAPVGSLLFRGFLAGPFSPEWIRQEVKLHEFYYVYMTFGTPFVFALFGFALGHFIDRFFTQRAYLENLNSQLKAQSIMDDLTGRYNHRHIIVEIDKEIERARRYKHTLAGMMIDVDEFKKFNDKHGHLAGDYVLREVANAFDQSIRKIDILGRYGGDEFLIILPESNQEIARIVADRIQKTLAAKEFTFKGKTLKVTVSIGLFFFEKLDDMDVTGFIESIDKALMKAKSLGKNRVHSLA